MNVFTVLAILKKKCQLYRNYHSFHGHVKQIPPELFPADPPHHDLEHGIDFHVARCFPARNVPKQYPLLRDLWRKHLANAAFPVHPVDAAQDYYPNAEDRVATLCDWHPDLFYILDHADLVSIQCMEHQPSRIHGSRIHSTALADRNQHDRKYFLFQPPIQAMVLPDRCIDIPVIPQSAHLPGILQDLMHLIIPLSFTKRKQL